MTLDLNNLFEAVPVEREMPPIGKRVSVSFDGGINFSYEAVGKAAFNTPQEVRYTHWLRPIPRERIEEALRDKFKTMYQAGNRKGLAGYGLHNKSTEYDMEMHITELINQILGSCSQHSIGDKH